MQETIYVHETTVTNSKDETSIHNVIHNIENFATQNS